MTDLAADVNAELEEDDAKELAALKERQRQRREALVPAMALSREIAAARAEFEEADRERVDKLNAAIRQARKNGAPAARLDALKVEPLGGRKRAPRRSKRTVSEEPTPTTATPIENAQAPQSHAIAV